MKDRTHGTWLTSLQKGPDAEKPTEYASAADLSFYLAEDTLVLYVAAYVPNSGTPTWIPIAGADGFVKKSGDTMTGPLQVPAGTVAAPGLAVGRAQTGLFYDAVNGFLGLTFDGANPALKLVGARVLVGSGNAPITLAGTTAIFQVQAASTAGAMSVIRANAGTGSASLTIAKTRGATLADHVATVSGDNIATQVYAADDGVTYIAGAAVRAAAAATFTENNGPTRMIFATNRGAASYTDAFSIDSSGNFNDATTNSIITAARHFQTRAYTVSALPAIAIAGQLAYASNAGGGNGLVVTDGTLWRRAQDTGTETRATDAAFTLTPLTSAPQQFCDGTLTADRAITLSATGAYDGAEFNIARTGAGAFNYTVVHSTGTKNIATNGWARFKYSATASAWRLVAAGTL